MKRYFSGNAIFGDDLSPQEVAAWYRAEEDAYAELYAADPGYEYEYDAVNVRHGFRWLPQQETFSRVLGLGSAYGDELRPIVKRLGSVVVVDSSDTYQQAAERLPVPLERRKAKVDGDLPLATAEADLAVCFGVLHHIPNVTHVVAELGRVVRPDGWALIREPIVSMGDWRAPRPGLTPHERGIPRHLLLDAVRTAGFAVQRETLCFFRGTAIVGRLLRQNVYAHPGWVRADEVLSRWFAANYRYHAVSAWEKLRPTSTFLVLRRRSG